MLTGQAGSATPAASLTVEKDQSIVLSWNVQHADRCTFSSGLLQEQEESVGVTESRTITIDTASARRYHLFCSNGPSVGFDSPEADAWVQINVKPRTAN